MFFRALFEGRLTGGGSNDDRVEPSTAEFGFGMCAATCPQGLSAR
eukprot:CAMPEP_0117581484 /NCGR_PEP_ID=MMETSP0784-20121206/65852_1 /TAXON_ID=39447 /ORGANISM="" /LENGTH=44 /DNA_ID= /DNA_START= /DNA_END= /DNA_ORIENTATION=